MPRIVSGTPFTGIRQPSNLLRQRYEHGLELQVPLSVRELAATLRDTSLGPDGDCSKPGKIPAGRERLNGQ